MWTKLERLEAVLHGEPADRPPVSAWRHFTDREHSGAADFADAMLKFQEQYDWDYLKAQNRATYYEEVWGGEFQYEDYEGGVVAPITKAPITCAEDLEKIVEMPASAWPLAEQVEACRLLVDGVKDGTPIFNGVFCPAAIFQKMCAVFSIGRYRTATRSDLMVTLIKEHPVEVHRALKNITRTMASYAQELVKTGIYGIFYAATGLSRTGYLTKEEWEEFVKPYDIELIQAMKPLKIMVHDCGILCNPEWFADYPIDILHWPESATGNPSLDSAPNWIGKITPMGGCDERPFGQGQAEKIRRLTRATINKMKDIPFVLAPDCSISVNTSDAELRAFIQAAHESPDFDGKTFVL